MQREGNEQCDLPLLLFLGSRTNSKRCSPRIPESKVDLCHNPTSWSHLANNFCLQLGERHLNYSRFLKTNATKPCLKASAKFCCLIANATLEGKRGATKKTKTVQKVARLLIKTTKIMKRTCTSKRKFGNVRVSPAYGYKGTGFLQ